MSPFDLSQTLPVGGGLLVPYSLPGSPVIKQLMEMVTMVPGRGGWFQSMCFPRQNLPRQARLPPAFSCRWISTTHPVLHPLGSFPPNLRQVVVGRVGSSYPSEPQPTKNLLSLHRWAGVSFGVMYGGTSVLLWSGLVVQKDREEDLDHHDSDITSVIRLCF